MSAISSHPTDFNGTFLDFVPMNPQSTDFNLEIITKIWTEKKTIQQEPVHYGN